MQVHMDRTDQLHGGNRSFHKFPSEKTTSGRCVYKVVARHAFHVRSTTRHCLCKVIACHSIHVRAARRTGAAGHLRKKKDAIYFRASIRRTNEACDCQTSVVQRAKQSSFHAMLFNRSATDSLSSSSFMRIDEVTSIQTSTKKWSGRVYVGAGGR